MNSILRHPLGPWGLSLLTPALLILSFPDYELSFLAWVSLVPLLLALTSEKVTLPTSFLLGWLGGSMFFYGTSYWITYPMIHYGGIPSGLAFLVAVIPAVLLGIYWGPVTLGLRWIILRGGAVGLLSVAPLWVVMEWVQCGTTGLGWNLLGYSQAFHPRLIAVASVSGVYGVSFLLAGAASLMALGLSLLRDAPPRRFLSLRAAVPLFALFCALVVTFAWQWVRSRSQCEVPGGGDPGLSVMAVQPNLSVATLTDPLAYQEGFEQLIELTRRGTGSGNKPDLVIWPESPLNLSVIRTPEEWLYLSDLVRRAGFHLLLNVIGEGSEGRFYNSVVLLNPRGQMTAEYRKQELLPFGEYVPLRGVIPFIDRVPALAGDFSEGEKTTLAEIGTVRIGGFICSESVSPAIPRTMTRQGAKLLVEVTNNGWFGPTQAARQHLAHAVLRAVENGRHLVRVTNTGISAHILPDGNVLEPTRMFSRDIRRSEIPSRELMRSQTFYTRWGDWFVILCGSVGIMAFGHIIRSLQR